MKKFILFTTMIGFLVSGAFAGVEWTTKLSVSGKHKKQNNVVISKMSAQGGDVRQEFTEISREQGLYKKENYWLYKSKENMMYIVNTKEKTYMPISIDGLLQMTGALGQLVKIQIKDHQVKKESLGNQKIAGYNCKHIRLTSDYTMKMKITIIKKTIMVHEVKEYWGSKSVPGMNHVSSAFLKKDLKTGFADLDKMIEKEMAAYKNIGFPIKTVTHTVQKNKKGKKIGETTSTTEVLKIKAKKFSSSYFTIPKDYQRMETGPAEGKKKKKKKFGLF